MTLSSTSDPLRRPDGTRRPLWLFTARLKPSVVALYLEVLAKLESTLARSVSTHLALETLLRFYLSHSY
jgi:hypothetical protein